MAAPAARFCLERKLRRAAQTKLRKRPFSAATPSR